MKNCGNTCDGPDDIHNQNASHLPATPLTFLLAVFNCIWKTGDFLPIWRGALALPFLKPKKSGSQPHDYRPIALTSRVCKLLEGMINVRLMLYLASKSLLSPSQSGFRCARSTGQP